MLRVEESVSQNRLVTGTVIFLISLSWFPCLSSYVLGYNTSQSDDRYSGGSREGAQGGPRPLIFRPNWGPKDQKNFFGDPPFSKGLDDPPPPSPSPYLKVWIRHCIKPRAKQGYIFVRIRITRDSHEDHQAKCDLVLAVNISLFPSFGRMQLPSNKGACTETTTNLPGCLSGRLEVKKCF